MADDPKDDVSKVRRDLDEGLRFMHTMEMQTKAMVRDTAMKVTSLLQELIATGTVEREKIAQRMTDLDPIASQRDRELYHIRVGDPVDKYTCTDLPQIDCDSIIPICKARCCTLSVFLTFQDLDERVLQWDYTAPYLLKRGADNYCVHNDTSDGKHRCTAYHHRPATCRLYDCRNDKRIWVDFEKRILAPIEDKKEQ
jgi:Fe-S-cluster containining protein